MSLVRNGCISTTDQLVDQKKYDENYERIFGTYVPGRGMIHTKSFHGIKDKHSTLDNPESSISRMMRDKTMVRMIRGGKAEDRGLKREAELIERENSTRPKERFRQQSLERLNAARLELRRSQQ